MKITELRRLAAVLAVVASAAVPLHAISLPGFAPDPQVSVSAGGGITAGDAHELVYSGNQILSELVWPMDAVWSFALGGTAVWKNGLTLDAHLAAGLPYSCGKATDSDFLNLPINGSTAKTHFSQHDAILEHSITFNFSAGWQFNLPATGPGTNRKITVRPEAGFKYLLYKWSAHDGYLQYADSPATPTGPNGTYLLWTPDTTRTLIYGTGIIYQQELWMPTLGFVVVVPVLEKLAVNLGVSGSALVYGYATDYHIKRTNTGYPDEFYDTLSSGFMVEPAISAGWKLTDQTTLLLSGQWTYISGLRGDTTIRDTATNTVYSSLVSSGNGDGASFNAATFRLGIETHLR